MERSGDPMHLKLPDRIFAFGDEPVGVRVTPYHKPGAVRRIIKALEAEEVEYLRRSPFGRIVDIAELPSFSGRFGRYIISRQLKVKKRHEVWFIFAGKPIRFSIREFARVTGLNCSKLPTNSKKRCSPNINEKPYWGELFGTLKDVPVESVLRMLERKTVTDRITRIKYACLALLSSVLLPTTHSQRISQDHAEKIKDLDEFLSFPWGRVAFELLMSSIKERNEISLSQNTIALKGFVMSLQLLMIEAVPALTEIVRDGSSSGSEGELGEEDEMVDGVRRGISPAHARDIDISAKVDVVSIVASIADVNCGDTVEDWSDDEEDMEVSNLMKLIEDRFVFSNAVFSGGMSKGDVNRMREEANVEAVVRKVKKQKAPSTLPETVDAEFVAAVVKSYLKEDVSRLEGAVSRVNEAVSRSEKDLVAKVGRMFETFTHDIAGVIREAIRATLSVGMSGEITRNGHSGGRETGIDGRSARSRPTSFETENIIQAAINFGNQSTTSIGRATTKETDVQPESVAPIHPDPLDIPEANHDSDTSNGRDMDVDSSDRNDLSPDAGDDPDGEHRTEDPTKEAEHSGPFVEDPSFSLGLTQEELVGTHRQDGEDRSENVPTNPEEEEASDDFEVPLQTLRKSKRARVVPKALVGEYACEKRLVNQARVSNFCFQTGATNVDYRPKFARLLEKLTHPLTIKIGNGALGSKEFSQIIERKHMLPAKIVDVLMYHTLSVYQSYTQQPICVFLDTKFVSQIGKCSAKFKKCAKKDTFIFPATLSGPLMRDATTRGAQRFYFPFNLDKTHWIGICADTASWSIVVLDCNIALRSDSRMLKELKNISVMFPYLLRQACKPSVTTETKPMNVERPRSVPQNSALADSAMTSVLFIQAHAVAGVEKCKCITPDVLPAETERLLVAMFEENVEPL